MLRLGVVMLALGVVGAAGTASATVYVPGYIRDGVYVRPHFVSAPERPYRPKLPVVTDPSADDDALLSDPLMPDPLMMDESLPAQKLLPEKAS
jgi:hypothetical protein